MNAHECKHRWIAYSCGCRQCSFCGHFNVCGTWRADDINHYMRKTVRRE